MKSNHHRIGGYRKQIILCGLLIFFQSPLFAQTWQWAVWAGSADSLQESTNWSYWADTDLQGNVYITGSFRGAVAFGNDTIYSNNSSDDIYVAKYDNAGNVLWVRSAGGADYDEGNSISVDDSGNVYIAGLVYGSAVFGTDTLYGSGQFDMFLAKYNTNGALLWAKVAGSLLNDAAWGIKADNAGSVYVTGYFNDMFSLPCTVLVNSTSYKDIFLARYDAAGTCLWAQRLGGGSADQGYALATDDSANVYLTGIITGTAQFDTITLPGGWGYEDAFVARFHPSGSCVWVRRMGGMSSDYGYSIACYKNRIYVTGSFTLGNAYFGNDTLASVGSSADGFVVAMTTSGDFVWVRQLGGYNSDTGYGIETGREGEVYVCGAFSQIEQFSGGYVTSKGLKDAYVARFDSAGTMQWFLRAGGVDYDYAFSLCMDPSGHLFVTGTFAGEADFGPFKLAAAEADIFLTRLMLPVGVNEAKKNKRMSVYPNPSPGNVTLYFEAAEKGPVEIINTTGQVVWKGEAAGESMSLHAAHLPDGIYFIRHLKEEGLISYEKLIIQK